MSLTREETARAQELYWTFMRRPAAYAVCRSCDEERLYLAVVKGAGFGHVIYGPPPSPPDCTRCHVHRYNRSWNVVHDRFC